MRPNVLFISIDDLNDWLGVLDTNHQTKTPNIDRLAARGVTFTNAHCPAPLCGASRAAVLTGMQPGTTGIYLHVDDRDIKQSNEASASAIFLPDAFEAHGYQTYGAGKIFHQGDGAGAFDEYVGHKSFGPMPNERIVYDPEDFGRPGLTSTDWGAYPATDEEMPDYAVASFAISQLQQRHVKPFFLAVGFNRPHTPWYVPEKWFDLFPLGEIQTPPYLANDLNDISATGRVVTEVLPTPTTEWAIETNEWSKIIQAYLACVAFVDAQVGRVLDELDKSPYADNTIVVLWSDHGYHLGEKGRFAKMSLWERSTNSPLIFSGPDIPPGKSVIQPVGLIDIYPTLLSAAGLPADPRLEGHSLLPLMRDPVADWQHWPTIHFGPENISLISISHRYIVYEDGSEELYDTFK